ncbi:MAG: protein transcription factor [Chloroflexi bacterium]|nr:protein transcription factor [Chloroflexota bacterium]
MALKNEETCALARELAELTGETMTGAITVALRERLERERHSRSVEARIEAIHAIQKRVARLLGDGPPPVDHAELLYDEHGLPK